MSTAGGDADRIEREIAIDAPLERVWDLVTEPGWWIGDGDPSRRTITREGDVVVVEYQPYGRFPVLTVASDAPRYISYRAAEPGRAPEEGTLVEFFLSERDGGTVLRVVESGFSALAMSAEQRAAAIEDNTGGWEQQLGFAKRDAEHVRA